MIRYLSIVGVGLLGLAGSAVHSQVSTVPTEKADTPVRTLQPTQDVVSDPRLAGDGKLAMRVQVNPANSMKPEEKDAAAGAMSVIRQRAALYDLEFNQGDWQQSELECPAFPHHLFLRFTRNRGTGDVSMFTASIPRGSEGRVRVIPILRRGYALITPAPESKLSMAAFNQIAAEEHLGSTADWSAVSLCYAALTSSRWIEPQHETTLAPVGSRTLQLEPNGDLTVAVELGAPAPGRWAVTYDGKGQLQKTEYTAFGDLNWQRLPAPLTDPKGTPIPTTSVDQSRPVPTGPAPKERPVPSEAPANGANKPQ